MRTIRKTIRLRAHTERLEKPKDQKAYPKEVPPKWPNRALILDCETTIDGLLSLTFGSYQYGRNGKSGYETIREGLFYADDLAPRYISVLKKYGKRQGLEVLSRSEFIKRVFWRAVRAEALIVGFNLPFDLTRLAAESSWTPRRRGAWSLTMSQYRDAKTGRLRENKFRPRITIKPKDGKGSFFRIVNSRNQNRLEFPPVRCLDLKTLFWALYNKSHTLDSACRDRGVTGKVRNYKPTGKVTVEEIEYNRQDTTATVNLLNALKIELDRHPIDLNPDHAFSPASVAKSYLKEMGLLPPVEKFDIPPRIHGIAMQSYFGGRVESRIPHTAVPVVYLDFMSQYPTVNTGMGLWPFLTAEELKIVDATAEMRRFLARVSLERTFDRKFWKKLTFFALVKPSADIFPVRTDYNGKNSNIGVNQLTSDVPVWFAGPDIIASILLTGKIPEVIEAIRVLPVGTQSGLKPVRLRGTVLVDPVTDDFFKRVIESRSQLKSDATMPESERKALAYFLKILANSGSYGLFVELNPERIKNKSKTNRERVRVFSGNKVFETSSEVVEAPGP